MKKKHKSAFWSHHGKSSEKSISQLEYEKPSYPFYKPTLFIPDWVKNKKPSGVFTGGNYVPLPNQKVEHTNVSLYIDFRVYKELQIIWEWAEKNSGEIAWFMPTHRLDKNNANFHAWGYYLVGQEASVGEVEMDGYDCVKYWEYLSGSNPGSGIEIYEHSDVFPDSFHLTQTHGHKHPGGVMDWSGIDISQQTEKDGLAHYDSYRWYVLYTPPNHLKADLMVYDPAQYRVKNASIGLYVPETGVMEISKTRINEIHKMCGDLVKKKNRVIPYTSYQRNTNYKWPDWASDDISTIWPPSPFDNSYSKPEGVVTEKKVKTKKYKERKKPDTNLPLDSRLIRLVHDFCMENSSIDSELSKKHADTISEVVEELKYHYEDDNMVYVESIVECYLNYIIENGCYVRESGIYDDLLSKVSNVLEKINELANGYTISSVILREIPVSILEDITLPGMEFCALDDYFG